MRPCLSQCFASFKCQSIGNYSTLTPKKIYSYKYDSLCYDFVVHHPQNLFFLLSSSSSPPSSTQCFHLSYGIAAAFAVNSENACSRQCFNSAYVTIKIDCSSRDTSWTCSLVLMCMREWNGIAIATWIAKWLPYLFQCASI